MLSLVGSRVAPQARTVEVAKSSHFRLPRLLQISLSLLSLSLFNSQFALLNSTLSRMLQRPRGLDHNQENPHSLAGPSHHINNNNSKLDHKTPARSLVQGKGNAPVTGGKGGPSTAGRGVLGRKDGNQGKGGNGSGGNGNKGEPGEHYVIAQTLT